MTIQAVIGDVHGDLPLLETLVNEIAERHAPDVSFRFLGDLVDRGPDSRGVIDRVLALKRLFPVTVMLGNHDAWFLKAMETGKPDGGWFEWNGGDATLASYRVDVNAEWSEICDACKALATKQPEHLALLRETLLLDASGPFLFAHAGIDPDFPLEYQAEESLLWIREPFLEDRRPLPGIVVHGHTPTMAYMPGVLSNRIELDTGCGKWRRVGERVSRPPLSAMLIDEAASKISFLQSIRDDGGRPYVRDLHIGDVLHRECRWLKPDGSYELPLVDAPFLPMRQRAAKTLAHAR